MTCPIVIEGDTPLMQVDVDGQQRWRECHVDTLAGAPPQHRPITEGGEVLVQTLDGRMFIVRGPR